MTKIAIIIACENHQDANIPVRQFAGKDASAFSLALQQHGFAASDQIVLLNENATKSIVESRIRKTLRAAKADDIVYLWYAAHGFCESDANRLTCHDSQLDDLPETSIPLRWVLAQFAKSRCQRAVLFFDVCAQGLLSSEMLSSEYADFADDELHALVSDTPNVVCFTSCQSGETSWRSGKLNHGIWGYHVTEAFNGDAATALSDGTLLTTDSLQNHLVVSVERTLRTTFVDEKTQSPQMFGGPTSELVLADLQDVLARRHNAKADANRLVRVTFAGDKTQAIQSLSGFIKGRHRIPDAADDTAIAFAGRIAGSELNDDLDETHTALKTAFRFKRADLEVGDPEEGSGTIITPYFTYNVNVLLNPADPAEVLWRREVTDIKQADYVFSDAFVAVFDNLFDTIAFAPPTAIDLLALIDRVEDLADDRLTVNYDRENTWCRLNIEGQAGEIHVTRTSFRVVKQRAETPRALAESFFEIQRALVDFHNVRLIPFDP